MAACPGRGFAGAATGGMPVAGMAAPPDFRPWITSGVWLASIASCPRGWSGFCGCGTTRAVSGVRGRAPGYGDAPPAGLVSAPDAAWTRACCGYRDVTVVGIGIARGASTCCDVAPWAACGAAGAGAGRAAGLAYDLGPRS